MHHDTDQQPTGDDRADEIAQLREQLAFYESFDQLIQDNISRAGELLREAAARKSEGELALRTSAAELERQQLAERVNYRRIFSALLDDVTTVQQNVERLARQVADALDDLEAIIPAQGELAALENDDFPTMPTFSRAVAGELESGEDDLNSAGYDEESGSGLIADPADIELGEPEPYESLEPVDELVTADEAIEDETDFGTVPTPAPGLARVPGFQEVVQASVERVSAEMGASEPVGESETGTDGITVDISVEDGSFDVEPIVNGDGDDGAAPESEPSSEVNTASSDDRNPDGAGIDGADDVNAGSSGAEQDAPVEGDTVADEWIDDAPAAATTLLVHGVPRATTALSLKRYLEGLEQVHSVEPREYAEGVLRLQVESDRPVGLSDLLGWPEGSSLEPVEVRDDFVEVRLGG